MGLALVQGIILRPGDKVRAEDKLGEGARLEFHVRGKAPYPP